MLDVSADAIRGIGLVVLYIVNV